MLRRHAMVKAIQAALKNQVDDEVIMIGLGQIFTQDFLNKDASGNEPQNLKDMMLTPPWAAELRGLFGLGE